MNMESRQPEYILPENELREMREFFRNEDIVQATKRIQQSLEDIQHVPLNVAVTGESGSGKSTFINVMCGLEDEEENAAKTGVVETTMEPTPYSHPLHRNVKYWDLPGIGTSLFNAIDYVQFVNFSQYDFFVIITSERFRECHIQLAQAIRSVRKKFYFVRSKVDVDLNASRRRRSSSYDEEKILRQIRDNCVEGLCEGGIKEPQVFIISCLEIEKYDFYLMQKTLRIELPSHKRNIYLLSMPHIYGKALEEKRDALRKDIWKLAIVHVTYNLPSNGDVTILVKTMTKYKVAFGLDERSLNKLANSFGKDLRELKAVIRSPLILQEKICDQDISREIMSQDKAAVVLKLTKYAVGFVPMIGSLADAGIAFGSAYWILYSFLTDVADDAARVLLKAFEITD